jgi:hypothetical protein
MGYGTTGYRDDGVVDSTGSLTVMESRRSGAQTRDVEEKKTVALTGRVETRNEVVSDPKTDINVLCLMWNSSDLTSILVRELIEVILD